MAETDLIQEIRRDHKEIESLLAQVAERSDADAFADLVRRIEAHEATEQAVVHPLASANQRGEVVADACLAEEAQGKAVLETLKRMGTSDPSFASTFAEFREAVLTHAEHEENDEHPLLAESADPAQLRDLGSQFRNRERSALQLP